MNNFSTSFMQFAMLFGMSDPSTDSVSNKMEETLNVIRQVNEQLKDAVRNYTYFFCTNKVPWDTSDFQFIVFILGSDNVCLRVHC